MDRVKLNNVEQDSGQCEKSTNYQELGPTDPLPALFAVIPREHERDEESDNQEDVEYSPESGREPPPFAQNVHDLPHQPGAGQIGQGPLDHLALLQASRQRRHAQQGSLGIGRSALCQTAVASGGVSGKMSEWSSL